MQYLNMLKIEVEFDPKTNMFILNILEWITIVWEIMAVCKEQKLKYINNNKNTHFQLSCVSQGIAWKYCLDVSPYWGCKRFVKSIHEHDFLVVG